MTRRALVAALLWPACTVACAQLLSYDDYAPRPVVELDAAPPTDASFEATSEVADVADAAPPPARLPERPPGPKAPGGGRTLWVAVKRMFVGSQTSLGVDSAEAWRGFGLDLDRVCTSDQDSIDNVGTCRRASAAAATTLQDGDRCRDNNFGQLVVPLIKIANGDFEKILNEAIFDGTVSTWMLSIEDLGDGADDGYAPGKLYFAAPTAVRPAWDGTDARDVRSDSLIAGDLGKPLAAFPDGYVRDHVWSSGLADITLLTPLTKHATARLRLPAAAMTLALTPDHASATRGGIAGALPLATVEDFLDPILTSGGICPGTSVYSAAKDNVLRFPDLVVGAPDLQDVSKPCDAISIGVGFDVAAVRSATKVVAPPKVKPGPCDG